MGLTTAPILQIASVSRVNADNKCGAMSQGFHQNIFSFSDGFDRQTTTASQEETHHHHQAHQQQQQHHIAQQSRRDKMRVQQGFDPPGHSLPSIDHGEDDDQAAGIYEGAAGPTGNMLSDMFNFNAGAGPSATDLLASQIQGGYRLASRPLGPMVGFNGDWYNSQQRQGIVLGAGSSNIGPIGDAKQLSADSAAAAMQLFLMNPQQQQAQQQPTARSPSPPHPPSRQAQAIHHSFQAGHYGHGVAAAAAAVASFSGGVVEGQGLSLSLSSSLQQFEMAKAEQDLRVRDGVLYFNNTSNTPQQHPQPPNTVPSMQLQGQGQQSQGHGQNVQMGYGPGPGPVGVVNVLRNSRYSRAAQELLEEFCSVGRGQFKGSRIGRHHHASTSSNPNPSNAAAAAASTSVAGSSSTSKDVPALSPADRFEHQRKKSKLLSMLDEVDRRYNHYCDQMQMVVNSFDSVMGFGAATPYTALAQKAMSRHFRCLKDAIAAQLKRTCELLGEKEAGGGSGITKGETPRLRLLDQSLRQQRAFHQMGMMEQEAWRPQRGLPERSVNILRAWLFEHFLHPYPSDADKHLLARQTGLSRNQVSNWFINARVRLWKPMVEEMYQQESKDEEPAGSSQRDDGNHHTLSQSQSPSQQQQQQQQPQHHHQPQQLHNLEADMPTQRFPSDSSSLHARHHSVSSTSAAGGGGSDPVGMMLPVIDPSDDLCGPHDDDIYREYGAGGLGPATRMRLGTAGDVSLTLGLRHAGNAPEKNRFSVRDYGGC